LGELESEQALVLRKGRFRCLERCGFEEREGEDAKGNRVRVARKEDVGYFCGALSTASNQSTTDEKG